MIQLTQKAAAAAPAILATGAGAIETETLKASYNAGNRNFEFNSNIYANDTVKNSLLQLQHGKCCFCEAKITHISYGDVEHFRPKKGWVQDEEQINRPGYYWLAYKWDNLILSCQICNQRYKRNYFPLLNPGQRGISHNNDERNEKPFFIHPALENPEQHITFVENVPKAVDERGDKTIKKLHLDREELNEHRLAKLNPIRDLYLLAKDIPVTNSQLRLKAFKVVQKYFADSLNDSSEYASMIRNFFKANPLPVDN